VHYTANIPTIGQSVESEHKSAASQSFAMYLDAEYHDDCSNASISIMTMIML